MNRIERLMKFKMQFVLIWICIAVFSLLSCTTSKQFKNSRKNIKLSEPTFRESNRQIKQCQVLHIGDKKVKLKKITSGERGVCFFNMHDDENTSIKAARKYLRRRSGILYYLCHGGNRNIRFKLNNQYFAFDPNRIFTEIGIRKTLVRHGPYTNEAHQAVAAFASNLLNKIDIKNQDVIVALHNNGEHEYSSSSYLKGRQYEKDAAEVYQGAEDHDDFYFVTDSFLYTMLKGPYRNVVLQNNETATDDGSLSYYCGHASIPYVNVEAQHGHKHEQYAMLLFLEEVIDTILE